MTQIREPAVAGYFYPADSGMNPLKYWTDAGQVLI